MPDIWKHRADIVTDNNEPDGEGLLGGDAGPHLELVVDAGNMKNMSIFLYT